MDNPNEEIQIDYFRYDNNLGKDPLEEDDDVEKKTSSLSRRQSKTSNKVETVKKKTEEEKNEESRLKRIEQNSKRLEKSSEEKRQAILLRKRQRYHAVYELPEEKREEILDATRLKRRQRYHALNAEALAAIHLKRRQRYHALNAESVAAINLKRRQQYADLKLKNQKLQIDQPKQKPEQKAKAEQLEPTKTTSVKETKCRRQRKPVTEEQRVRRVMENYLYRQAKKASATEEDIFKAKKRDYLRKMATRIKETPEEREQRLQRIRDNHIAKRLSMTPQEQREYREGFRLYQQKRINYKTIKPYSEWSEEKKEKMRESQRERTKQETPEQRHARLERMKKASTRRNEIIKMMKEMDISKEEAENQLKLSRPDLYVHLDQPRRGRRRDPDKPYVPRLLKNQSELRKPCKRGPLPSVILTEQEILAYIAQKDAKRNKALVTAKTSAAELIKSQETNQIRNDVTMIQEDSDSAVAIDSGQEKVTTVNNFKTTPLHTNSITPEKTDTSPENNVHLDTDIDTNSQRDDDGDEVHFSQDALSPIYSLNEDEDISNETVHQDQTVELNVNVATCDVSSVQTLEGGDTPEENDTSTQTNQTVDELHDKGTASNFKISTDFQTPHFPVVNQTIQTQPRYICDTCGKEYMRRDYFNRHVELEFLIKSKSQTSYTCPVLSCAKVFLLSFKLLRHYNIYHELKTKRTKTPKCTPTQRNCYRENDTYRQIVDKLTDLACPYCKKEYQSKPNLTRHIRVMHGSKVGIQPDGPFVCDQCPRKYKHKATLDEHIRRDHMGMLNQCDICHRQFQTAMKLCKHKIDAHQITLDPSSIPQHIKTFKCDYCDEMLMGTGKTILVHVKSAHPEKFNEFRQKQSKVIATPAQKVKCPQCHIYVRRDGLRNHLVRLHSDSKKTSKIIPEIQAPTSLTDESQSVCDKCHKKCRNDHNLTVHIMANHGRILGHGLFVPSSEATRVCFFCKDTLEDFHLFKFHLLSRHIEEFIQLFRQKLQALVQCPYCDVKHTKNGLIVHIQHRHKEEFVKKDRPKPKHVYPGSQQSLKIDIVPSIIARNDLESNAIEHTCKTKNDTKRKSSQRNPKEKHPKLVRKTENDKSSLELASPVRKSNRNKKRTIRYIVRSETNNNSSKLIVCNQVTSLENRVKYIYMKLTRKDKSILKQYSDPKLIKLPIVKLD